MNFDKNTFILMCFLGISVVLNWRKGKTKYFFLVVVTPSHSMNYGKYFLVKIIIIMELTT